MKKMILMGLLLGVLTSCASIAEMRQMRIDNNPNIKCEEVVFESNYQDVYRKVLAKASSMYTFYPQFAAIGNLYTDIREGEIGVYFVGPVGNVPSGFFLVKYKTENITDAAFCSSSGYGNYFFGSLKKIKEGK